MKLYARHASVHPSHPALVEDALNGVGPELIAVAGIRRATLLWSHRPSGTSYTRTVFSRFNEGKSLLDSVYLTLALPAVRERRMSAGSKDTQELSARVEAFRTRMFADDFDVSAAPQYAQPE